ncbi:AsnC family transcriptional regulator [Halorientalis litorea]|uniref:AsnC family transcriptional regulator n=1 Tax=Halorientalis litorea TaxID=2931977 RepID=UPI001FF478B7|nr:AsnC family transcriptional regulator [Halorientalis litorea]
MRGLDDTDRAILRLLLEDARRPYSDIAERVDLSPPAVSDRVDRLQDIGLVRRFTADIDRSMLREGVPVLVDVRVEPGHAGEVQQALDAAEPVDNVFRTADERIVCTAIVPDGNVGAVLSDAVPMERIDRYDVDLLADTTWSPSLADAELAPECAECGNTVTTEGEAAELDGTRYHFCCSSCRSRFTERFEEMRDGIES